MQLAWSRRLAGVPLKIFSRPSELLAAAAQEESVLSGAKICILDNRFGPSEMLGEELAVEIRKRTAAPIVLSSDDSFPSLPAAIDACLAKGALSLEEVELALAATREA